MIIEINDFVGVAVLFVLLAFIAPQTMKKILGSRKKLITIWKKLIG